MYKEVLKAVQAGKKAAVVTLIPKGCKRFWTEASTAGTMGNDRLDEAADQLAQQAVTQGSVTETHAESAEEADSRLRLIADPYMHPMELVILGGGSISEPLSRVAVLLGYAVDVVDDRAEFTSAGRFPHARRVICGDFGEVLDHLALPPWASAVIITRGHQHDLQCLEKLVRRDLSYLGMIGSKKRITAGKEHLRSQGAPQEAIDRVFMPIGLDTGAQTPEEIAVTIAAEMIKVVRGGAACSMADQLGGGRPAAQRRAPGLLTATDLAILEKIVACREQGQPLALATITSTRGSTPRKAGAKMLVFPDGNTHGTIGGGIVEEKVRQRALAALSGEDEPRGLLSFSLEGPQAAAMGMICGGDMEVYVETLSDDATGEDVRCR